MHKFTYGMLHQNASRPLPTTKTLTDVKNAYMLTTSPVAIDHSNTKFTGVKLESFILKCILFFDQSKVI